MSKLAGVWLISFHLGVSIHQCRILNSIGLRGGGLYGKLHISMSAFPVCTAGLSGGYLVFSNVFYQFFSVFIKAHIRYLVVTF